MSLSINDLQKNCLARGGLQLVPSVASMSTRVNSSSTLADLDQRSEAEVEKVYYSSESSTIAEARPRFMLRKIRNVVAVAAVAVLAALWQRYAARRAQSSRRFGLKSSASAVVAMLSAYMSGIGLKKGVSDFTENPERVPKGQAVFGIHPHGAYLQGIGPHVLKELRGGEAGAPSRPDLHILAADAVFQVPFFREICLTLGMRAASNKVVNKLLTEGSSVALAPGGIHEQSKTDPEHEQLFFPSNLGFVRTAMKHGIPLVPLYNFGENQLYKVPQWSRSFSQSLKKKTGAGFTLGVGRWGLPMMMPFPQKIHTRLGREVEVGPANANPTDAEVEKIFRAYCTELLRLFEEHKSALPDVVAARGLSLVWRGHEAVDLSGKHPCGILVKTIDEESCGDAQTLQVTPHSRL